MELKSSLPTYATTYNLIGLSLAFLAIASFPQFLRHEIDIVLSILLCSTLLAMLSCLGGYKQCCTQLKMLHKCSNTDVLRVSLIYPHSPLGAAYPRESCVYISQTLAAML